MKSSSAIFLSLIFINLAIAGPVLQMNRAFIALTDLMPFLTHRDSFMEKKNEKIVQGKIVELQSAFKDAKHDKVLKEGIFAPSYAVVNESIDKSLEAFKKGKKDYSHWRLKEITTHCLDCHTRLPPSLSSSFQNGEFSIDEKKFDNIYNLGIAQLIVRRYFDAKNSFLRSIQDQLISKDTRNVILSFKQILVIEAKVLKNPENLIATLTPYTEKKEVPADVRRTLKSWGARLVHWKGKPELKNGFKDDKAVVSFIEKELVPLKIKASLNDGNDVDLLLTSGLLSNYLFENINSKIAPEISFWLGWTEKHLKREDFFGPGDLFLKQCVNRYPQHPIALQCYNEYRESIEFDYTGSSGTHIPADIEKELEDLSKLVKRK